MAGHVVKRVLKQPEVDRLLLDGTTLWKWEEGDQYLTKLVFKADEHGFFLFARGDDQKKVYDSLFWDFVHVSDVRGGRPPKNQKLCDLISTHVGGDNIEEFCLTLVIRKDGIVDLDYINLVSGSPETAEQFKRAVNALTLNLLHAHASPGVFFDKSYTRILLHANGYGHILPKYIHRVMMRKTKQECDFLNQFLAQFNIVKTAADGTQYIKVQEFTLEIYHRMIDQILNNRSEDLDVVLTAVKKRAAKIHKIQLSVEEFHGFLNGEQRDPRLNEILHPFTSMEQARALISRHEKGRERLTAKGLLEYLMSEDNNILDLEHLDQHMDMSYPLTHYFINSSHNTYLTGHQLRSASTSEMYIQALLQGCRCLELDCWPDGEDIVITHGQTFCGKVSFKEVVEAINEFAFVRSDYPLILSIENHCKKSSALLQRMATLFTVIFGDKLMKVPFDDLPLEPGVPLPSPERLRGKILLKDKVKKHKGEAGGTIQRGVHMPTMDKLPEVQGENSGVEGSTGTPSESTASPQSSSPTARRPSGEQNTRRRSEGYNVRGPPDRQIARRCSEGQTVRLPSEGESGTPTTTYPSATDTTKEKETDQGEGDSGLVTASPNENGKSSEESGAEDVATQVSKPRLVKRLSEQSASSEGSYGGMASLMNTPVHKSPGSSGDLATLEDFQAMGLPPPRHSEVEALVGGPLIDLLNYCQGISFDGFASADKMNCSYFMSSFVEEKGLGLIKSQAKDYVKYNVRQMSRVYPQGTRINSSNYMPQIYWNVGCQLVALNYQTSDLPMQLNYAKFEFNGGTGYILRPWVMMREKAGSGPFNPFVQRALEDIVPAKLSLKVISGFFLTEKRTNCYVEAELYGLPADTNRHKFYTKRAPAPNPSWKEEPFTFKRILLPELAMLRVAVFDDDRDLVGQRLFPIAAIRPGFRHIPLRDKHNQPLPLAMLFVYIKVEDWVPDEFEEVVAMLMDPISFASKALEELAKGEFEDNGEDIDNPALPPPADDTSKSFPVLPSPKTPVNARTAGYRRASEQLNLGLPPQLGASSSPALSTRAATLPSVSGFDDTLPSFEEAKRRGDPKAIGYDSVLIIEHPEYLKATKATMKKRLAVVKKHEKATKSLQSKLSKSKGKDSGGQKMLEDLQAEQRAELHAFDLAAMTERHEKVKQYLPVVHASQLSELERSHKNDIKKMNQELVSLMKSHRKSSVDGGYQKASLREIEDKAIQLGKRIRGEFSRLHDQEISKLTKAQKEVVEKLSEAQRKERQELEESHTSL